MLLVVQMPGVDIGLLYTEYVCVPVEVVDLEPCDIGIPLDCPVWLVLAVVYIADIML